MGDFNAALFLADSTASGSCMDISMREFNECVENIEVLDVQQSSLKYTWNQKPKGSDGILKKLDRIMANLGFNDVFIGSHAIFKPYRVSDHSPSVLIIPTIGVSKPKPFKFYNILTHNDQFKVVVQGEWSRQVSGFFMYRVVQKLKNLKKPFRKLLYDKGNLHANVTHLRTELNTVQTLLDADPFNTQLRKSEAACVVEFNQAVLMEERFLKQKAKVQWLKEGDSNSSYNHKAVKIRVSRSRIDVVTNVEGILFENEVVSEAFVTHYEMFLGLAGDTYGFNTVNLFKTCLNEHVALDMVRTVSKQEVKEAMFSMGDDKSPGPDAWEIVGSDVTNAICEFFTNGTLLKELNHTIIALIPKVNLHRGPNQSAFVPGRSISDNILLTQELMHNYHLDRGTPRCAFKVDIQKAYDTVDWNFVRTILHGFGFHPHIISWIMEYVTTTSYSNCINGSLHGYFHGKRGLRQGDPLSPYLFTLVMEILTLMLKRKVEESALFTYDRNCSNLDLINLCFADDLFIFSYEDVQSVTIIKAALEEFKCASGLVPSLPKSTASCMGFFGAMMTSKMAKQKLLEKWCVFLKMRADVPLRGKVSWCWRKLLQLRPIIHEFIWSKIRNGANTSLWYDRWCDLGPLSNRISTRDMFGASLNLSTQVKDILHDGSLIWPPVLLENYPLLHSYVVPINEGVLDILEWRYNGVTKAFLVNQERNWRLFKSKKRTVSHVIDCVVSSVRLKLLSCKLKKSRDGPKYATLWDLPEALFV
nr:hypothetical protein [Tanacetum cinerariifolium]